LLGGVFGFFAGVAESGVAAGDEALHESWRDREGGGTLAGVEYPETAAGAGSYVEEAASLIEALGDGVYGAGDVGELGGYCGGYFGVLVVDEEEHIQSWEFVDVLGQGIAGFSGESG
jgi:hypothetical protein